ncbi:membrane protein [Clostridia bacterium]|nr:membrane protein [Clostridia bacterium]
MDFKKIFIKDACPTKVGGQAVLEGIMMKGEDRTAVVVRMPGGQMHIKTERLAERSKAAEIPIVRGVYIFVSTLITGMKTLMYSAEVLGELNEEEGSAETSNDEGGIPFGVMIALSVVLAIAMVVGIFIIVPTVVVNFLGGYVTNAIALNLIEGAFRIMLFVVYIAVISNMKDIRTTFEYHGAEHKTIHCYESGLPLTPANAAQFETLHPRCGTSFLMFVMIIALLLFSLLGWPDLLIRIATRILFIPVIAGLSYELLRFAGRSDSWLVKTLSVPGLLLQQLTTKNPDERELEVAIAALNAVMVPADTPVIEGFCAQDGTLLPAENTAHIDFVDIILEKYNSSR